jgi:uncharacterized UPF0160 family protein
VKVSSKKNPKSLGTHNGRFHADEVTACALLLYFNIIDRDKIFRTREPSVLETCEFVCDVGGYYDPKRKLFDHHQASYQGRLSSAGMVLLYMKEKSIIPEGDFHLLNNSLVRGIDEHDNGFSQPKEGHAEFSLVVSNFIPITYTFTEEEEEKAFNEALDFVLGHLDRLIKRYHIVLECKEEVKQAMDAGGDCLVFKKSLPWIENFFELDGESHPAKFIIMPAGDLWKLRGIPPDFKNRMQVRKLLPSNWAGLLEANFQEVSGIEGAVFCHKERFISMWKTFEGAKEALNYVLNYTEEG